MRHRTELQVLLEKILGSEEVYYQPPASVRMSYPAIRYDLNNISSMHANNSTYQTDACYSITLISFDPDDSRIGVLLDLPKCRYERRYISDNLYHNIFTIYF